MTLIADIVLAAAALGAALYCAVLSRRLERFNQLDGGMGGAIAVLSAQVDDMTRAISTARAAAQESSGSLASLTERAEAAAHRIELLLASMHELPEASGPETRGLRVVRRRVQAEKERVQ